MGQVQYLRHVVRDEVVAYADRHPDNFHAYMTAAAVVWFLAGRPGMPHDQQIAQIHQAEVAIAGLAVRHTRSATLALAEEHIRHLIAIVTDRVRAAEDAQSLAQFAGDFDQWAAELRQPDED